MPFLEPQPEQFKGPISKYFQATRPPFLLAGLVPCLIGIATAHYSGISVNVVLALLTVLGAVVIHAGINVLNDYYDALSGTDSLNVQRLYPFTGGSRFIQNRILTPRQTSRFGFGLLTAGVLIGLSLLAFSGPGLIVIGLLGLLIGWAYSAPPLALDSRGFGEVAVAAGFALIVVGADYVQRVDFDTLPLLAAIPYALLVTCLLFINEFPDREADEAAGKRNLVVRLGGRKARWLYLFLVLLAYGSLAFLVVVGGLPALALIAALPMPLSLSAALDLFRFSEQPSSLLPAITKTVFSTLSVGILIASGIAFSD